MINVSVFGSYLYCQRKLYLEKAKSIPNEVLILSSIKHEVLKKINKISLTLSSEDDLLKLIINNHMNILKEVIKARSAELISTSAEFESKIANLKNKLIEDAARRAEIHSNQKDNEMSFRKILSGVRFKSEELGISGIADQVEYHQDEIVPVIFKGGQIPNSGLWESDKLIAGLYIILAEQKDKKAKRCIIRYTDSGTERDIVMNPFLRFKTINVIEKVKMLLNQDKLPDFCDNTNKCNKCIVKEECYNQ